MYFLKEFFRDVLRERVSVKKLVTLSADQMITAAASHSDPNAPLNLIVAAADSTSISEMQEGTLTLNDFYFQNLIFFEKISTQNHQLLLILHVIK
jgi:hypothetical protein